MDRDKQMALIVSAVFTLVYTFKLLKNTYPYVKQVHKINLLKERVDLIKVEAEVIDVEELLLNGLKIGFIKLYEMQIRYHTENNVWGIKRSELIFPKEPSEHAGQKIKVLYCRDKQSTVTTPDRRELAGAAMLFAKIVLSIAIVFGSVFTLMYGLSNIS